MTSDQQEVVAFLANPSSYRGVESVRHIETHTAHVFLAGAFAYKLKRAVTYDFLDFSTLDKRRAACEAEVVINRRTAPDIYLRAQPVLRQPNGGLALDGPGNPVEWVVVLRRFDEDGLYDRLASRHAVSLEMARELADEVRRLHTSADARPDHGGVAGIQWVVDRNAMVFDEHADILPAGLAARVTNASREAIDRHSALLESRRQSGHVRQCHGDLHLRNIVAIAGRPVIFDAIEFNDRIACTDVLYDLAFLVMDLLQFSLPGHASEVLNRYLERSEELDGLALMPLFLASRAAVRAKVIAIEARLAHGADAERDRAQARAYLERAEAFLRPSPPRLIAIGGLSGSGKTTLAARLAPGLGLAPGAVIVRSDVLRKQLFHVLPEQHLGPDGYSPIVNRNVYDGMVARCRTILAAGYSAIADGTFASADDRAAIEQVASDAGVPFSGIWLQAPPELLRSRVSARTNDASDATADVVDRQLASAPTVIGWSTIDTSAPQDDIVRAAREVVESQA
jgi:uncharacterized protein